MRFFWSTHALKGHALQEIRSMGDGVRINGNLGFALSTPDEFENGGFIHITPEEFVNKTITSHFGYLWLRKTTTGKSHDYCDVIVFVKPHAKT